MIQNNKPQNVDEYINLFPAQVQLLLQEMRKSILAAAPDATEKISYGMPGYKYKGMLVYFAGYKKHIGFYPTASGIEAFKDELSVYHFAKGSVQFPLDQPLPIALITKIVQFRVDENEQKNADKTK